MVTQMDTYLFHDRFYKNRRQDRSTPFPHFPSASPQPQRKKLFILFYFNYHNKHSHGSIARSRGLYYKKT